MTEVTYSECGTVVRGFLFHTDQCGFVRRGVVDQELKPCGHRAQRRPWPDVHNLDAYLPREEVRDRPCPHDPDDRLAIIKHRGIREDNDDGDWLIGEVERLRGRLRELEDIVRTLANWAPPVDSIFLKECGLCHAKTNGMITDFMLKPERHKRDCPWRLAQQWLAETLRSTSP